ncbi:hypothetical protein QE152_g8873 [Popillia japonica]|uniref:Uncharacterized protein n=1 Tax=Popillia japonica TaxID=7064 RepID=A0AAW1LWG6_POPJA
MPCIKSLLTVHGSTLNFHRSHPLLASGEVRVPGEKQKQYSSLIHPFPSSHPFASLSMLIRPTLTALSYASERVYRCSRCPEAVRVNSSPPTPFVRGPPHRCSIHQADVLGLYFMY